MLLYNSYSSTIVQFFLSVFPHLIKPDLAVGPGDELGHNTAATTAYSGGPAAAVARRKPQHADYIDGQRSIETAAAATIGGIVLTIAQRIARMPRVNCLIMDVRS